MEVEERQLGRVFRNTLKIVLYMALNIWARRKFTGLRELSGYLHLFFRALEASYLSWRSVYNPIEYKKKIIIIF